MSLLLSGTNGLSDVDGSASTPAVRGTDTNTGIFFPASDTIAFAEGGAEVARIDSNGNLGIGTTSPTRRLDIRQASVAGEVGQFIVNSATSTTNNAATLWFGNWENASTTGIYNSKISAINMASGSAATDLAFWTYNGNGDSSGVLERMRITSGGLLQFNSGYGSVATAYGCRAWVNFNGVGTVSIRASGNVSSITDNGTGNYSINLTNAMPDVSYCAVVTPTRDATATGALFSVVDSTSSLFKVITRNQSETNVDCGVVSVSVFR
jgi:hypothetical protein